MFSFLSRKLYHTAVSCDLKLKFFFFLKESSTEKKSLQINKEQKQKHADSGLQLLDFLQKISSGLMKQQLFGHNDHCQIWRVGAISIILLLKFKDGSIGLWIGLTENIWHHER